MPRSGKKTDVGALLFYLDPRDDQAESRGNKCNESTYQENTQGDNVLSRYEYYHLVEKVMSSSL